MEQTTSDEKFEMWARVDLMGHNTLVGKLSVVNTGVEVLYRLDRPDGDKFTTKFFGKGAIYSIDPVSEDAARLIAQKLGAPAPLSQWDLPEEWQRAIRQLKEKALPEKVKEQEDNAEKKARVLSGNCMYGVHGNCDNDECECPCHTDLDEIDDETGEEDQDMDF